MLHTNRIMEEEESFRSLTSRYFCEHIGAILHRVAQEGISFRVVDEGTGNEVIICPIDQQKHVTFAQLLEQHYKMPIEEILKDVRWECTEECWKAEHEVTASE